MFGRVFQNNDPMKGFRRLAWIRSDGQAYLDIGFNRPQSSYGTSEIGLEMEIEFPQAANVGPCTIFGSEGGFSLNISATGRNTYVPDTNQGTDVVLETTGSPGEVVFIVSVARNKYGDPQTATVTQGGKVGIATFEWSSQYNRWSATVPSNYGLNYACVVTHYASEQSYRIGFADNPFFYNPTGYGFSIPDQTPTGLREWSNHESSVRVGNITQTNGSFANAILGTNSQTMRVLFSSASASDAGCYTQILIGQTTYNFSGSQPATHTFVQTDSFVFARNGIGGTPGNFCSSMKLHALKTLTVSFDRYGNANWTTERNLVPAVREQDDAVGLFDLTRRRFYGNAGSGAFQYAELTH